MKKKGISIGALIFALILLSKGYRFLDAFQHTNLNNSNPNVKSTATYDDCRQDEVTQYFTASNKIADQFEYTSDAAHRAYAEQLDLDYPPCLKELYRLTTDLYYYRFGALYAREKGDTESAEVHIKNAENAYTKMMAELDRLEILYGWDKGSE
jgi:hypothetical protein